MTDEILDADPSWGYSARPSMPTSPQVTSENHSKLVTSLVRGMSSTHQDEFNVFSVMHHGRHEKQLSNIFAWLLDAEGSHRLGDLFLNIFLSEVEAAPTIEKPVPRGYFAVRQEVNTSPIGEAMDIADIVLDGGDTVIVVENYYTSDGHGHGYDRYATFAAGEKPKRPIVVLLCRSIDETLLTDGWEKAPVLSYRVLLKALIERLGSVTDYATENPDQNWFIQQMYRFFVKGEPVNADLLNFVAALCEAGEAERFRGSTEIEADKLADDLRELSLRQYKESRDLLQSIKGLLRNRVAPALVTQLNAHEDSPNFGEVNARYAGIYQWTINLGAAEPIEGAGNGDGGGGTFQIKFGPSAWYANAKDKAWKHPVTDPDYSRLFFTWGSRLYQSQVTMHEIADGLPDDDQRLFDEALAIVASKI